MRDHWEEEAANDLKAQIKRAGFSYAQVAQALSEVGVPMTAPVLTKKLHRGSFSHAFFLQCSELVKAKPPQK